MLFILSELLREQVYLRLAPSFFSYSVNKYTLLLGVYTITNLLHIRLTALYYYIYFFTPYWFFTKTACKSAKISHFYSKNRGFFQIFCRFYIKLWGNFKTFLWHDTCPFVFLYILFIMSVKTHIVYITFPAFNQPSSLFAFFL